MKPSPCRPRRLPHSALLPLIVLLAVVLSACGSRTPASQGSLARRPQASPPTETPLPTPTPAATQTPKPIPGSRRAPAKLSETISVMMDASQFAVTITQVITGKDAAARVAEANEFNEMPQEGYEYVLFYAKARIAKSPNGRAVSADDFSWRMVDPTGYIHTPQAIVNPEPRFSGSGFEGATIEGWSTFVRKVDEPVSLVFAMKSDGSGGAWFAIPGR